MKAPMSHHIVSGLLVCLNQDGRALTPNIPDKWNYCPYCSGEI